MGCQVSIQLEAHATDGQILQVMPARFADIEAKLSRFKSDSELMRLNAQAGQWVAVSNVLFENIRAARHNALLTDGLYNPLILPAMFANGYDRSFEQLDAVNTSPAQPAPDWQEIRLRAETCEVLIPAHSALDLGGIAKGWTARKIADELAQYGACLVNIGGDMVARGASEGYAGWLIEIEDPFTGECFQRIYLQDQSIATSGTDFRQWTDAQGQHYHHIIDPRTGQPVTSDVLSATVLHREATTAEAYAKALILKGAQDGLHWLNQQWSGAGLVFKHDGTAIVTTPFTYLSEERNL